MQADDLDRTVVPSKSSAFVITRFREGQENRMSTKSTVTRPKSLKAKLQPEVDLGFSWGLLNTLCLGAGVLLLVGGYLSLSKGSITLAPLLLVAGYCVFIPGSFLVRGSVSEQGE
jgi:hypothetical protein